MKIDHSIEFDAPREFVYDIFTDIHGIHANVPANIVLRPEDGATAIVPGSVWVAKTRRSGRSFTVRTKVLSMEQPSELRLKSTSNRLETGCIVELTEPEAGKTIVNFQLDLQPIGLLGRILVQSIKSSRTRVEKTFERGSERLKAHVEERYQQENAKQA